MSANRSGRRAIAGHVATSDNDLVAAPLISVNAAGPNRSHADVSPMSAPTSSLVAGPGVKSRTASPSRNEHSAAGDSIESHLHHK
ncbi:MAG: hypothetical protein K8U57_38190 [Planctomycetes bacterium]|nr:hypothetical protein [Planctomycetota bacterium]